MGTKLLTRMGYSSNTNRGGREEIWCKINFLLPFFHSQVREQVSNVRTVVSPLWRGPGNIHGFVLPIVIPNKREDNGISFTHVQPRYYCMRQGEPCHR